MYSKDGRRYFEKDDKALLVYSEPVVPINQVLVPPELNIYGRDSDSFYLKESNLDSYLSDELNQINGATKTNLAIYSNGYLSSVTVLPIKQNKEDLLRLREAFEPTDENIRRALEVEYTNSYKLAAMVMKKRMEDGRDKKSGEKYKPRYSESKLTDLYLKFLELPTKADAKATDELIKEALRRAREDAGRKEQEVKDLTVERFAKEKTLNRNDKDYTLKKSQIRSDYYEKAGFCERLKLIANFMKNPKDLPENIQTGYHFKITNIEDIFGKDIKEVLAECPSLFNQSSEPVAYRDGELHFYNSFEAFYSGFYDIKKKEFELYQEAIDNVISRNEEIDFTPEQVQKIIEEMSHNKRGLVSIEEISQEIPVLGIGYSNLSWDTLFGAGKTTHLQSIEALCKRGVSIHHCFDNSESLDTLTKNYETIDFDRRDLYDKLNNFKSLEHFKDISNPEIEEFINNGYEPVKNKPVSKWDILFRKFDNTIEKNQKDAEALEQAKIDEQNRINARISSLFGDVSKSEELLLEKCRELTPYFREAMKRMNIKDGDWMIKADLPRSIGYEAAERHLVIMINNGDVSKVHHDTNSKMEYADGETQENFKVDTNAVILKNWDKMESKILDAVTKELSEYAKKDKERRIAEVKNKYQR